MRRAVPPSSVPHRNLLSSHKPFRKKGCAGPATYNRPGVPCAIQAGIHGIVAQLAERTAETAADGRRRFDPCRYHQFNVDTASEKRFSGKSFGRCEVLK